MAWPILLSAVADFTAGPPNLPGVNAVALNPTVEVKGFSTGRGRQYELDQAEAGTLTLNIDDPNEQLSPLNAGSAWNTGGNSLLPYRATQIGAYLNPAATVSGGQLVGALVGNLLNTSNRAPGQPWLGTVYGYDPSFESWSILTVPTTGGSTVVTGLPTTALNSNTGFESGISPWVAAFCTATQSATQKHSGSFSCKIVPDGTDPTNDLASELVTVVPGRQYTVTAWVWVTTAVTSKCDLALVWADSSGTSLGASIQGAVSIPATTWTQVTFTATAPPTAATTQVHVQMQGTQPASNIFYVDDVSLTNFAAPADTVVATAPVSAISFASATDQIQWTPRFVPGAACSFTVDIWAPTGLLVTVGWHGVTSTTTTITGNNAYQTASLAFTTAAGDGATPSSYLYVQAAAAGSYPQTVYAANYSLFGQSPGWTLGGGATQHYTQTTAQAGNYSMSGNTTNATDSLSLVIPTVPGQQYTFSAYVFIQNTGTGLTATQTIGANTQTLSTASVWTRLSNTFTATVTATTVTWKSTTSAYPAKFYIDAIQLELAATASAFTLTGPVFNPIYTGWIERYPQLWSAMGKRGMRPLTGVDALSVLSRITPNTNYQSVIQTDGAGLYMPLNDAALPQAVNLYTGGFNFQGYTATLNNTGQGQVSFGGDTFLDGNAAVVVSQQNANPPTTGDTTQTIYLATASGSFPMNPQAFTFECWAKVTSGVVFFGAGSTKPGESLAHESAGPQAWVGLNTAVGQLFMLYTDPNGGATTAVGFPSAVFSSHFPNNQWQYYCITFLGSNTVQFAVNQFVGNTVSLSSTPSVGVSLDNLFGVTTTTYGDLASTMSLANYALYPFALSRAKQVAHYNRGIGYLGESDMARCLRMLNQYWANTVMVGTPQATMSADYYYFTNQVATISTSASTPPSLLQDLQDITSTGDGFLWVDTYGIVHVDSRETRYTQPQSATSQYTFSDNPTDIAGGALVYEDLQYDYDPTYVYSQAQLTVDGTNDVITVTNSTSTTNYGQRILSKTMYVPDDWQALQAANFYTQRYAAPAGAPGSSTPYRINSLRINPASNPALWQAALSLDIDDRITVTKKTAAGTVITGDYYIEQAQHNVDIGSSQWTVNYQLSPVWNPNPFIIGQSILGGGATWVY